MSSLPLAVDLDGTLIRADMLHESALRMLRDKPLKALLIPVWSTRGKAALKQQLARETVFDPASLPYHHPLLEWLTQEKSKGRTLILCTASDESIATAIAEHLGIFDGVMASDGSVNLSGRVKADALEARFGRGGFDYAGNERKDLLVWDRANAAIVVGGNPALVKSAESVATLAKVFPAAPVGISTWRRVLRVHQWMKNVLLFVPLIAAHRISEFSLWPTMIAAFIAFSLCASSVYISNDLLDLDSDRRHIRKRNRPFASGRVAVWIGVVLAPLFLLSSAMVAATGTRAFLGWVAFYFCLTCAYSWWLKRKVLVDCLTLAMLYTIRIVAGAAAASMSLSFWLLAFAVFLFLSLAFIKRYTEMDAQTVSDGSKVHGRGYYASDAPVIQSLGIASGYASVLVLALYLNTETVIQLYRAPEIIWGTVPVMLFWISWMWIKAHRGEMHDDPMVFAVKDKASLMSGAAFAAVVVTATLYRPW